MARIKRFFTHSKTLAVIGIIAILIFVVLVANSWRSALLFIETLVIAGLAIWGLVWLWRRHKSRKAASAMENMLDEQAADAVSKAGNDKKEEISQLRNRLLSAVKTIKSSKIGHTSGRAALYELPWYMIIGNPAAGKSTAIINSGLQFPLEEGEGHAIQGVGGTRNCDWFFTTEGILLDTAGRFSVHEEDRREWLGFVDLLKKHRPKAPLNGIIIAASVADLTERGPEFAINLAKQLRQRVQELTERLEIFAPVYVLFTKADLIAGFNEFFADADMGERARVWGVSLPYDTSSNRAAVSAFDDRFAELYRGLKEMSLAQMAMKRGQKMPPGVFTFPLEFASIKPAIQAFITSLFEENPYQFNPVFRGFYFTSAAQEGVPVEHSGERITQRFGLESSGRELSSADGVRGFFLSDLFRRVVFADSGLVRQYASPGKTRTRYAVLLGAVAVFGLLFAGWTWSYVGNRQLLADVQDTMQQAEATQKGQFDLESRFDALNILQQRIEQLDAYNADHPFSLSLGLYHGNELDSKLREEYFNGVKSLMLQPVKQNLEAFLAKVGDNAKTLKRSSAQAAVQNAGNGGYQQPNPADVKDAYNALETYLMLGDKSHVDVKHLYDQLTRFWRGWLEANRGGMPREKMIGDAEQVISFYLGHVSDPNWPTITDRVSLVADTRNHLRKIMAGLPAEQRVYAEIKARASTRFPPVTVAAMLGDTTQSSDDDSNKAQGAESNNSNHDKGTIAGSYAVSGAFTHQAWASYIKGAFKKAATQKLQSKDWVLRSSQSSDLTLQGSPEEIEKRLTQTYKSEYAKEWRKFTQGLTVQGFSNFSDAVQQMDTLGDPNSSPLRALITGIYLQTAWDNPSQKGPSAAGAGQKLANSGILDWFKRVILRRAPSEINRAAYSVDTSQMVAAEGSGAGSQGAQMGQLGADFSGIAQLVKKPESGESLLGGYLQNLSKIRTRMNQIANQGDPGPGSEKLMRQTLLGKGSELADSLQYIQEQMLPALPAQQRAIIRPLLVRPLVQTFAAIVTPAEREINKEWHARIYKPYKATLATKYPFSSQASVEASGDSIARIFGPSGAIARFADQNLQHLVIQRGNTITPRTWADIGLSLTPTFTQNYSEWVASIGGEGVPNASVNSAPQGQTVFQVQPQPAPGTREYTLVLDGQKLTYRNTPPQWSNFVWPNPEGSPGVSLNAVTFDGRNVELINFPGHYGLRKLIQSSARERIADNLFKLSWSKGNLQVAINLRIISSPSSGGKKGIAALHLPSAIVGTSEVADSGSDSENGQTGTADSVGASDVPQNEKAETVASDNQSDAATGMASAADIQADSSNPQSTPVPDTAAETPDTSHKDGAARIISQNSAQ